ncbi:uncharacterized protein LOC135481312 [Liolophura sinensis]|uniref:uncharacterized protein LOC135481312 n=1 Tax=Liolophura sinensis TaxID=3198878 RepID=UPI0031587E00
MSIPRSWTRFLSVFLTEFLLLLVKIDAQSLEVRTGECSRFIGSQIEMTGKYNSLPGDPTEWQRPDITGIGTCQPNVSCTPFLPGYKIYYNNSGLDYTLLITAASPIDEGLWELIDGVTPLSTSLTFTANLTAVNVNCAAINTSSGYTESVTCTTECVEDAISISYNLSANLPTTQTHSNSTGCPTGARYSSTIPLDSNLHSGISELCYILSSGNCNHTQTDHCISVVIRKYDGFSMTCRVLYFVSNPV